MEEALAAFQQHLRSLANTRYLDGLRATAYPRLDQPAHGNLDYTGGGLYAECQRLEHMPLLSQNVFGNSHSTNPASQAVTDLVEPARACVLEFVYADPQEYEAIFTPMPAGRSRRQKPPRERSRVRQGERCPYALLCQASPSA
jgi:selenocysteine lyase/cysteine desulfurase